MVESIGKNLWLLLTILIPGFFTYGSWMLIMMHFQNPVLDNKILEKMDSSSITVFSIILAIAIAQQIGGIVIEALLAFISYILKNKFPNLCDLFNGRFKKASENKLNDSSKRIIGNCFLSINILIGLIFLFLYFKYYAGINKILPVLGIAISLNILVVIFRIFCAVKALKMASDIENAQTNSIGE